MTERLSPLEFARTRASLAEELLGMADRTAKKVISADSTAWGPGALSPEEKELTALSVSLALRCDDCVRYHLWRCAAAGASASRVSEAMGIACLIGGTIVIPHQRRAAAFWNDLTAGGAEPVPGLLVRILQAVLDGGGHSAVLERVCELLREAVPRFGWAGFYLVDPCSGGQLVLGPFSGAPTEHVRIRFGQGVCGQAAASLETILVDDVSAEPNYLSCSPSVRSEAVVPVFHGGRLAGELDIDSDQPSAFSGRDRVFLEAVAAAVAADVSGASEALSSGRSS
jgi:GAF domain-containing protein